MNKLFGLVLKTRNHTKPNRAHCLAPKGSKQKEILYLRWSLSYLAYFLECRCPFYCDNCYVWYHNSMRCSNLSLTCNIVDHTSTRGRGDIWHLISHANGVVCQPYHWPTSHGRAIHSYHPHINGHIVVYIIIEVISDVHMTNERHLRMLQYYNVGMPFLDTHDSR